MSNDYLFVRDDHGQHGLLCRKHFIEVGGEDHNIIAAGTFNEVRVRFVEFANEIVKQLFGEGAVDLTHTHDANTPAVMFCEDVSAIAARAAEQMGMNPNLEILPAKDSSSAR
mgnify:CR=1 FL=1